MSATISWESRGIAQSHVAAYLVALRESCSNAVAACGLMSDEQDGVLIQAPGGSVVTLSEGAGQNTISPTDLSGGGVLTMPDDHGVFLCLLHVSAVFGRTFKLSQEPQIQFATAEGQLLLSEARRDWEAIASVLLETGVPEKLVNGRLRRIAIHLKLAGEPLDIRTDRIADAFF